MILRFATDLVPEQCLKPVDVDVREGRTFPVIE